MKQNSSTIKSNRILKLICILFLIIIFTDIEAKNTLPKNSGIIPYIKSKNAGKFDSKMYRTIIGMANEFKEGDHAQGLAANSKKEQKKARLLLENTPIKDLHENPLYEDELQKVIWKNVDLEIYNKINKMTLSELKLFILTKPEAEIKQLSRGLNSDVIACVVKLMSNADLIKVGQTIFNPLPGSKIGSKGYMGARIQPNSPTDDPEDVRWQVFDGFSYAVGDVMLGNNPADSTPESVEKVELALKDIVETFKLKDILPWSVLAHIDVQAQVEKKNPGSTELWFQSIAGVESANNVYDISTKKMIEYALSRKGYFGLYLETGQGSEFTNGQGKGMDMLVHESRKYGLAKALKMKIATVKVDGNHAYVVINDVAGFIGPEVFKSKEQLVRACLEDIAMGKLHELAIGLDICTTLHMSVSLDELQWCQDQILPANPAYLMALPTRNDPMLSYLTTSFQDHVRLRSQFNYKVEDKMWEFYKTLGVIDSYGNPTEHFGDPIWVFIQYQKLKGDTRSNEELQKEGREAIARIKSRGVPIAEGYGKNIWDLESNLDKEIHSLYDDAKKSIWTNLDPSFIKSIPNAIVIKSNASDRNDYIGHPVHGENIAKASIKKVFQIKESWKKLKKKPNVQIVISEGLNARALMDEGHFQPYYKELQKQLRQNKYIVSPKNIVLIGGRVRAGYRIGEMLFKENKSDKRNSQKIKKDNKELTLTKNKSIILIIGERPGNGHQTFSAYLVAPNQELWNKTGVVDHNIAKLVSGIADTALDPTQAAKETVQLLNLLNQ